MHEWALAEAVVKTVLKIAGENRFKKVLEVRLKIGEIQRVEHEIFESALLCLKPVELKGTKFTIEVARTELKCRVCNHRWFFEEEGLGEDVLEAIHFLPEVSHVHVKCSKCGSPDFEVIGGRGVWIESVRGATENG